MSGISALGQDAFLQLLTTQLKFQDPLQPMESTEFVTQLAQFSELEQTAAMNETMGVLVKYSASMNDYAAAGLIGKEVQAVGRSVSLTEGTPLPLTYSLGGNADKVTIQISSTNGDPVRLIRAGSQSAGTQTVRWDGRDDDGNLLPGGGYTYTVAAVNRAGEPVGNTPYASGRVSGVTFESGIAYLTVNGQQIPASGVVQIINSGS